MLPLLITCLFSVDKTSQAQVDTITSFVEEYGHWLETWENECKITYPDFEHDVLLASELTLTKLHKCGIVLPDTSNVLELVNSLLMNKINLQ